MLLIASDSSYVVNLEDISRIYVRDKGYTTSSLVCEVPSAINESGYEEFHLGVTGTSNCTYQILSICKMYKQYVVTDTGNVFIPPKVYNISINTGYIVPSQVSVRVLWDSARITFDNKASISFELKYGSDILVEGRDYTVTLPLFRGQTAQHRFLFHLIRSNTYFTWGVTYTNGWKTFTEDLELNPQINVNT